MRRAFLYLLCCLWLPSEAFAFTHTDGCSGGASAGGSTISCTLSATVPVGYIVVGAVSWQDNGTTLSNMTTDKSDTGTVVDTLAHGGATFVMATFYFANLTSGAQTIQATLSGVASFTTIVVDVYSGIAKTSPLDGHAIANQTGPTGTDSISSGSFSDTVNDLVWGGTTNQGTDSAPSAGTGFTLRQSSTVASNDFSFSEDKKSAAASLAATFTNSATDNWTTAGMAFKPACSASLLLVGVGC